jgi:methylenetetrahydrofolate reductase (NADPH)
MVRPSFDIDSVGLLSMYSEMNRGRPDGAMGRLMKPTNFFLGAVVTNHKRHEREVVRQYLKLRRKIETGARFIINEAGHDARKDDQLLRWLALSGLDVPVIANVFVLPLGAARAFNAGRVPGVVVTYELATLAERYAGSADRGRSVFLDLAAKQVAIARGLGFRGAYLGGKLDPADCEQILSRADEFGPDGWKVLAGGVQFAYPDEFYYFECDEATGLSSSEVNGALLASRTGAARRRARLGTPVNYRASRLAHWAVFDPEAPLFDVARRLYSAVELGGVVGAPLLHRRVGAAAGANGRGFEMDAPLARTDRRG